MTKEFRLIRIYNEDWNWLMKDFEEDYINHYPEFRNIPMSFAFKVRKLIDLWERSP